jgi:hypothetical protein
VHAAAVSIAQESNPTVYPYGGIRDSTGLFFSQAKFNNARFDNKTIFGGEFGVVAEFNRTHFLKDANFLGCDFNKAVYFERASFDGHAEFGSAKFHDFVDFSSVEFNHASIGLEVVFTVRPTLVSQNLRSILFGTVPNFIIQWISLVAILNRMSGFSKFGLTA